jgi:hypothetical protein
MAVLKAVQTRHAATQEEPHARPLALMRAQWEGPESARRSASCGSLRSQSASSKAPSSASVAAAGAGGRGGVPGGEHARDGHTYIQRRGGRGQEVGRHRPDAANLEAAPIQGESRALHCTRLPRPHQTASLSPQSTQFQHLLHRTPTCIQVLLQLVGGRVQPHVQRRQQQVCGALSRQRATCRRRPRVLHRRAGATMWACFKPCHSACAFQHPHVGQAGFD